MGFRWFSKTRVTRKNLRSGWMRLLLVDQMLPSQCSFPGPHSKPTPPPCYFSPPRSWALFLWITFAPTTFTLTNSTWSVTFLTTNRFIGGYGGLVFTFHVTPPVPARTTLAVQLPPLSLPLDISANLSRTSTQHTEYPIQHLYGVYLTRGNQEESHQESLL